MVVLYLDFDGVLHPDAAYWSPRGVVLQGHPGHALFEHVPLLESALAPYPDVRIVLSTSWVPDLGFSRARKRLGPQLAQRVIGATFHSRYMRRRRDIEPRSMDGMLLSVRDDYHTLPRGMQVWNDVCRRKPDGWLALDDNDEGWPEEHRHRLVLTDSIEALAAPASIAELADKLKALQAELAIVG